MEQESLKKEKRDYVLPASILISALIVGLSLVYSAGKNPNGESGKDGGARVTDQNPLPRPTASPLPFRPVSATTDHIFGDPNAPVKIIEYSDLECPFCKVFHKTLAQAVSLYEGKVAWVYRHFPLDEPDPYGRVLHAKARKEAVASECATDMAGNNGFWKYVDRLFQITPSNDGLDPKKLPEIAKDIGLDVQKFNVCLESGKFATRIAEDLQNGKDVGGQGTPYSVVVAPSGKTYVMNGALPLNDPGNGGSWVKLFIDTALREKEK